MTEEMEYWKIKNEEPDIKDELEKNETRFKESIQSEARVKIEIAETINDFEEIQDWTIKCEELNFKEDLGQCDTSILQDCVCQDDQVKCELNTPQKHDQLDDKVSLQSDLYRQLPKNDHCMDNHKIFKCDQCSYKTTFKKYLNNHLLRHRNPEEVEMSKCNNCDFQTKHKSSLLRHLRRHNTPEELKKFKCDQCSYKTIASEGLKRHLLRHRNPEEVEMFKCNTCGFQTKHKNSLKLVDTQ